MAQGSDGGRRDGHGSHRPAQEETFERWYVAHHDRLLAQCARILSDHAAAEDVAQEALLRAWSHRSTIRDQDVGSWLSVVARNLCLSIIRRDRRLVPLEPLAELSDESADPLRHLEAGESKRSVRRALSRMRRRDQRLLLLREVDGLDYRELSSELGLTAAGVRTAAFRARRVFREHLQAVGEGFSGLLVGVRVRIRSMQVRARRITNADAILAPMFQAGLSLAVATGLAFSAPVAAFASQPDAGPLLAIGAVATHSNVGRPAAGSQSAASSTDLGKQPGKPLLGHSPVKTRVKPGDYDCNTYPDVGVGQKVTPDGGWMIGVRVENQYRDPRADAAMAAADNVVDLVAPGTGSC